MPAKPEASHKAKRDAASFEKFNATFFEGFLWSGDETVKVDTAKLIELFDRYFKSEDYPTLDELRETVSFLHRLLLQGGEEDSYRVYFRKDFDEVSDFFEENLEGSFKVGLDACRNQSRSSKSAHSIQVQGKLLPADPQKLVQEFQNQQERIDQLKREKQELSNEEKQILAPCPRLKTAWEDERTGEILEKPVSGAARVKVYLPRSRTVETVWKLPTQAMTEDEKIARRDARKLSFDYFIKHLEIEKAEQRLDLIEKRAESIKEAKERLRSIKEAVLEDQQPDLDFEVHDEEGFTSFTFRGKRYDVGAPQGKAIKLLYEEGKARRPDVSLKRIREVMDLPPTSDVRDSGFKRKGLWKTLLVSKRRNTRRLSIFS